MIYTSEGSLGSTKAALAPRGSCCSSKGSGCREFAAVFSNGKKRLMNVPQPPALNVIDQEDVALKEEAESSFGCTRPSK